MSTESSNRGSSGSGGESSSSSLRPSGSGGDRRAPKSGRNQRSRNGLQNGNPLDKLCKQILSWNILEDVSGNICPKSFDYIQDHNTSSPVSVLPDVYDSYMAYVEAWEPLMIREVQDSLVSKFPSLMNTTVSGTFHSTVLPDRGADSPNIQLECTFNHDQRNGDGSRRTASTMDLMLITLSPFKMPTADRNSGPPSVQNNPYSTQSITVFKAQKYALGLIVSSSNAGPGPRTSQVLVSKGQWSELKTHFQDGQHVSTYKGKPRSGANLSNNLVGKIKSYKLHYIVVDSLRSSWREFQALHDLGLNVPLMAEILGSERTFTMAATPPYNGPEDTLFLPGDSAENPFLPSPPGTQGMDYTQDNSNSRNMSEENTPLHSGLTVPLFSRQTSAASDDNPSNATMTTNTTNATTIRSTITNTNITNTTSTSKQATDAGSVHSAESAESNTSAQERAVGAHRMLNRLEIIEQVINSWRMKGCTEKFMRYLRLKYNPSQLHAIHTAVDQQGFTLVQGPPGTGKTSTILGILNAIHIREYNGYYKLALEAILGTEGMKCRAQPYEHPWLKLISRLTHSKPRILVVAPSNTAVDNIILRIMESGFVDGNGGKYYPNILRVGSGSKSPKIKAVTLEELVEKELRNNDNIPNSTSNTTTNSNSNTNTNTTNRREAIELLSTQITDMIKRLAFLQSMLVNLTLAYQQAPLPEGCEVRVDKDSGQPHWVDHQLRTASTTAPTAKLLATRGPSRIYTTLESIPDYIVYSHQLTQLLGAIEHASSKRAKLHALDTMTTELLNSNVRELAERSCIDSAHILFTTLNSAGHPSMESTEFCVTVVDEAAQSVEPSVLIALRRGCRQCIMVGDQQQLTATVFSSVCRAALYDRSLFQRLIETGHPYIMLDTQYRMCTAISKFPSEVFYKGMLKDGANVCGQDYLPAWLKNSQDNMNGSSSNNIGDGAPANSSSNSNTQISTRYLHNNSTHSGAPVLFTPFMFFDLYTSSEVQGPAGSHSNLPEALLCTSLIHALLDTASAHKVKSLGSIGVITFYSDQLQLLKKTMAKHHFPIRLANAPTSTATTDTCSITDLELNTVDGFQGKETDIIIISAVRANEDQLIGFLSDLRRMNVGLTRARKGLFIIGHAPTLYNSNNRHSAWRKLIDYAHGLDAVVSVPDERADLLNLLKYRSGTVEAREPPTATFNDALKRYSNGAAGKIGSSSAKNGSVSNTNNTNSATGQSQQAKRGQYKDRDYCKQDSSGTVAKSTDNRHDHHARGTNTKTNATSSTTTTNTNSTTNAASVRSTPSNVVADGGTSGNSGNDSSSSTLVAIGSNIVVNKQVVGWVNPAPTAPVVPTPNPPPPPLPPGPPPASTISPAVGGLVQHPVLPVPPAFRPPPPPPLQPAQQKQDGATAPRRAVDPRLLRGTPSPPAVPYTVPSNNPTLTVTSTAASVTADNNASHNASEINTNSAPLSKAPSEKAHLRVCKDRDYSQFSDLTYPVIPSTAVVFPTPKMLSTTENVMGKMSNNDNISQQGVHAPAPARSRRDTSGPAPAASAVTLGGISAPVVDLTNNYANSSNNSRKRKADEVIDLEDGEVVDLT